MAITSKGYIVVFLWIATSGFADFIEACPAKCQCVRSKLYCVRQNLTSIPPDIPPATTDIYLRGNFIKTLNEGAFARLTQLDSILINDCKLKRINPGAFRGLGKLKSLNLGNNEIEEIESGSFQGLDGLQRLELGNNQLRRIHPKSLSGLNLTSLTIDYNKELQTIAKDALEGSSVTELSLRQLNLTSDSLEFLMPLKGSLQSLVLARNDQPLSIRSDLFSGFDLRKLWVTHCGLNDVAFLKHVEADDLSLAGNDVGPINFSMFPKLEKTRILDLQETDFTPIDDSYFNSLKHLSHLYLQSNNIQTIPENLRPMFNRLQKLNIDDNRFHCNCEFLWFKLWLDSNSRVEVPDVRCFSPTQQRIRSMNVTDFSCTRPRIIDKSKDKLAKLGETVELTVTAKADPAPMIVWDTQDGEQVVTSPSHDRTETKTTSVLTIANLEAKHAGIYTVTVSNVMANISTTIAVTLPAGSTRASSKSPTSCSGNIPVLMITILLQMLYYKDNE